MYDTQTIFKKGRNGQIRGQNKSRQKELEKSTRGAQGKKKDWRSGWERTPEVRAKIAAAKTTHGLSSSPIYSVWRNMLTRCYNASGQDKKNYQDRGIIVCKRWRNSFENFYADMGDPPTPKHTLDRFPNGNGNYEPENCRWATRAEQSRNLRKNIFITFDGKTLTLKDWSFEIPVKYATICYRYHRGWPPERILSVS